MKTKRTMSNGRRKRLSTMGKARWAALSVEQRAARYRFQAANMMVVRPDIAIFPDRWIAAELRADA